MAGRAQAWGLRVWGSPSVLVQPGGRARFYKLLCWLRCLAVPSGGGSLLGTATRPGFALRWSWSEPRRS